MEPEKGKLISVDPFYNAQTFAKEVPQFERPKRKGKEDKPESDEGRAKLLQNVQHFDLYEYPDLDTYRQMISDTIEMRSEGMIAGHISKVFPLAKIQQAIEFVQQKQCTGKVLIDVQCTDPDEDCAEKTKGDDAAAKKKSKD